MPLRILTYPTPLVTDPTTLKCLKAFHNWCIQQGVSERNPFAHRKVRFEARDRLLSDDEVTAIWAYEHPPYSDIVKLLILTGQRRKQIWQYRTDWREGDAITFPSSIMKSNRAHALPVTGYEKFLPNQPFEFNSWSKAKQRMDKFTGITDYVLHDFRRYFSSTMARLGVPLHVTEQIIDHRSQLTGVAAIYTRNRLRVSGAVDTPQFLMSPVGIHSAKRFGFGTRQLAFPSRDIDIGQGIFSSR